MGQGFAVEPSTGLRREAQTLHHDPRIRWLDDRLPALPATLRRGFASDFVLISAVWRHVPPAERARAFRKIVSLLKPGDLLTITLRHGPSAGRRDASGFIPRGGGAGPVPQRFQLGLPWRRPGTPLRGLRDLCA